MNANQAKEHIKFVQNISSSVDKIAGLSEKSQEHSVLICSKLDEIKEVLEMGLTKISNLLSTQISFKE